MPVKSAHTKQGVAPKGKRLMQVDPRDVKQVKALFRAVPNSVLYQFGGKVIERIDRMAQREHSSRGLCRLPSGYMEFDPSDPKQVADVVHHIPDASLAALCQGLTRRVDWTMGEVSRLNKIERTQTQTPAH